MDAKELRIGNTIINRLLSSVSGEYNVTVEVLEFLEKFPDQDTFYPILLTEEWLVRLGFENNGSLYWYKGYDYSLDTRASKFVVYSDYVTPIYGTEVKYVHELQNLIYALTGEELIPK